MARVATTSVPWPRRGLYRGTGYSLQPPETTVDAANVRSYDPATGRSRGAQRAGISKFMPSQINSSNPIQCLNHLAISTAYAGSTSMAVRSIKSVAVAGGNVGLLTSSAFTLAASGTAALSTTAPVIHSAEMFGKIYFADGVSQKLWTASTNAVSAWTPTAGTFPSSGANLPRLITLWHGSLVLSGLVGDEHNWFKTRVGDPLDFDYGATPESQTMAVAGNASDAGKVGDSVTCLIPVTDELLHFGGDHTIWTMNGDPAAGGTLTQLTNITGIAFGEAYCIDPYGNIWFFGSRGGVYRMNGGYGIPERITGDSIDEELAKINLTTNIVRMEWNDREQGVHVFITHLAGSASTHYFYDVRNQAWWKDEFQSASHNPVVAHVFDGDDPSDRVIWLGCRDGYVRKWDITAKDDDSVPTETSVWIGPIKAGKAMQAAILRELQAVLASGSGPVDYEVYSGNSAEDAYLSEPVFRGQWTNGRNPSVLRGARGDAIFVRLKTCCSGTAWSLESLAARLELTGQEAQRAL